ncbi:MAG: LemA family protein [Paludibacteraceae bacterium]
MANLLDEKTGPVNVAGQDINVIDKQLPVTVGTGSVIFEICLWVVPVVVAVLIPWLCNLNWAIAATGILPGLLWLYAKVKAKNYFQQLEQKLQADASTIDNYLEQRRVILENLLPLVQSAIKLDKEVMTNVAALRSGIQQGEDRNAVASQIDTLAGRLFPQVEAYPELKAHQEIADAIQQNSYLQREITAARTVYNNRVNQWNRDIFDWPVKQIVAAKQGYTTRIPFSVSAEVKERARGNFFANLN